MQMREVLARWQNQDLHTEATSLVAEAYAHEDFFKLEQTHVFGDSWIYVGPAGQLPGSDTYFTTEVAKQPLLVTRDAADTIRAFFNICPHRSSPLLKDAGTCKRIVCPYHAWNFHTDGSFAGAPSMKSAARFDKTAHGLQTVAVAVWSSMIFVHLGTDPDPLESQLGDLAYLFRRYGLDDWVHLGFRDYRVDANWKLYQENISESYHEPIIHGDTWSAHYDYNKTQAWVRDHHYIHHSPLPAPSDDIASGRQPNLMVNGLSREEAERMTVVFFFPNIGFALTPSYLTTVMLDPLGPRETRVRMDWLIPDRDEANREHHQQRLIAFFDKIQMEDLELLPGIQKNIESSGFRRGRLSPSREMGLHHIHQLIMERVKRGL